MPEPRQRPSRPAERRVAIVHTDDPAEAFDFCRGVAGYRPAGGAWRLQSIPTHQSHDRRVARRLRATPCDGMIMMPGNAAVLGPLHARGVQVVDVEGPITGREPYPLVRLDDVHIGRMAAEHFLQRGFTRLLFLGLDVYWSRDRARGLAEAAREARAECRAAFTGDWNELVSEGWIGGHLRRATHPVAVMGCNDIVAARAIDAAEAQGWAVPTRIAVLGVDDRITECIRVQPPLSTISNERFRAGFEAARLLDAQFATAAGAGASAAAAAAPRPVCWVRPGRVIERESTSSHVYDDADVVAALELIRREACRGLTVDDLVDRVNVSRSTLERRFRVLVGRSPGHELRRVRLDAVKRALEQTRTSVADIASTCGFASVSSLSHCFRAATGVSPEAYRRPTREGRPPHQH